MGFENLLGNDRLSECISFNATNEPSLITEKVESFGAVNGFATVETNTLSSFTGFTQVSDVDLTGISATDTEKEMILSLSVRKGWLIPRSLP